MKIIIISQGLIVSQQTANYFNGFNYFFRQNPNYFSGVKGNYLGPSISRAGMDPESLPEADKTKMNFNSGGNATTKVWKDIYGAGQGISSIKNSPKVDELVAQMRQEFDSANKELTEKVSKY